MDSTPFTVDGFNEDTKVTFYNNLPLPISVTFDGTASVDVPENGSLSIFKNADGLYAVEKIWSEVSVY